MAGSQPVVSTLVTIFLSIKSFEKEILKEPLSGAKPGFFSDPLRLSRHRWTRRLHDRMELAGSENESECEVSEEELVKWDTFSSTGSWASAACG